MITPWYLTPEALEILADCARDEPLACRHRHTYAGRNTEEWRTYDDPDDSRIDRLTAIRSEVLTPLLNDADACRDGCCEQAGLMVSVDMAIDAVAETPMCAKFTEQFENIKAVRTQIAEAMSAKGE